MYHMCQAVYIYGLDQLVRKSDIEIYIMDNRIFINVNFTKLREEI